MDEKELSCVSYYVSSQSPLVLSPRTISKEEQAASSVIFMPVSIIRLYTENIPTYTLNVARAQLRNKVACYRRPIEDKEMAVFF